MKGAIETLAAAMCFALAIQSCFDCVDFLQIPFADHSMANPYNSAKKMVSFVGMVAGQASSSSVSYSAMLNFGSSLPVVQEIPSLNVPVYQEALCCEKYFSKNGLVCRFNGY